MPSRTQLRIAKLMRKAAKARKAKKPTEFKAGPVVALSAAGWGPFDPLPAAPEAAVAGYQLLHLSGHTCVRVDPIDAADDAVAVRLAHEVARQGAAELWIGSRRVAEFSSC